MGCVQMLQISLFLKALNHLNIMSYSINPYWSKKYISTGESLMFVLVELD